MGRTTLNAGECTFLFWDVDGVRAVFLDGAGRPGHSAEEICPDRSHTYTLKVVTPAGHQESFYLHVRVVGILPLTLNVWVNPASCDTLESWKAEVSAWARGGIIQR